MGKAKRAVPEFDDVAPWGTYRLNPAMGAALRFGQSLPQILAPLTKVLRHPVKYWVSKPLDLVIWGLKLRLSPRGNISEQKLYTAPGNFDRPELQAMQRVLENGGTFVDIGANAGVYSFWAHACSKGKVRVLGFEPDPEMCRRLAFNLKTNAMNTVTILPCALSDTEGTATFWVNDGQRGTNSLEAPIGPAAAKRRTIEVPIRTLSKVLIEQGITGIDVLKIDVEGHEPPILRHFFANAPRESWPRLLIGEILHLPAAELAVLVPQDAYELIGQTNLNAIWQRR